MTIAIVDDDLEDRDIFRALIAKVRPEATCLEFQNPQELAVYLSNHDELPHFLFVDMNMPRINGLECILQLRNIERYQHENCRVLHTHFSPTTK